MVEKVNMIKKAMRPTQQNPQGGISTMEAPIHVSNVMLVCPACKQATRVYRAQRRRQEGPRLQEVRQGHRLGGSAVRTNGGTGRRCGRLWHPAFAR